MKKLQIKLIPSAKKEEIILESETSLRVRVTAPAVDGKANEALIKLLAKYFDLPKSAVRIVKGETSRNKIVVIS